MESNENMENEVEVKEVIFHSDPFINSSLHKLNNLAQAYRDEHKEQTDVGDTDYVAWKNTLMLPSESDMEDIDNDLSFSKLAAWLWDDASAEELLAFVPIIDEMKDSINRRLRSYYNGKGGDSEDKAMPIDLSIMRAKLVNLLDSTMVQLDNGMFEGMTEDDIYKLPAIGPKVEQERILQDGSKSLVWNLPKAPKTKAEVKVTTNGARNLRDNNTKTRILIDGKDPSDYPADNKLGSACKLYFKKTVQQAGKELFNDWRDIENPAIVEIDGKVYGLTSKPRKA